MFFKIIALLALFSLSLIQITAKIQIGLISDHEDTRINLVFEKAIQEANRQRDIEVKGITAKIVYGNVFDASKKLCQMLQTGVNAILGPSSRTSATHLINICEAKEIPYIDTNLHFRDDKSTINLYPHPQQLGRAIYDLIKKYEWQQFTLLYESSNYLAIFDEIISLYGNQIPTITIRRYDAGLKMSYFNILREVKKSKDNSIIVLGSIATITELLKQGQQIGVINEYYEYIIGNLDFQTLDLRKYQRSDCNITAFRIVSPENERVKDLIEVLGYSRELEYREVPCPVTTQMALLYDGVQLFAEAAKHLNFSASPIDCTDDSHWEHGFSFNNYLAFVTSNKSLTGNIHFYFGLRTEFILDIVELTTSGLNQVGIWNSSNGVQIARPVFPVDINSDVENESLNQTFTVLIALTPPYGMLKNSADKLIGNDRYEGFGIELIKQLAYKLGFNYTFKLQEDNDYGSYNATTGEATGMLKEIINKRAHLAITDLTITSERALAVDFTIPFMNLGISILYRKAQKEPPKLFSFMDPFSKEVWVYLGFTYIGVSLSFFILGRLSPTEWDNPNPCVENPTELENQFSLSNSFWFTIGALLQQGTEIAAKAPSTRTASGAWGFFIIIMVSSYTANLAAFLTIESSSNPINDIHDLAKNKGGVKYGAKRSGATLNFFQGSKKYKAIYEYMQKHPELLPTTNEEGVSRVSTENYAFLMESTSIEYNVERNCNLTQIGDLLDEKGYGIAMHKDFKFRDKLNSALLELQEAGAISKLKIKWWQEVTDGCSKKKKEAEVASALGMPNLGGVYFVVLIGSVVAAICGIIKWILLTAKRAYKLKVPIKQELLEEFKFVMDLSQNTKLVKTAGSTKTNSRNSSVTTQSTKENIGGLISDNEDARIKMVFEKAIQDVNSDLDFQIKGFKAEATKGNIFDASKKLCRMFTSGVSAIFGPSTRTSASHLINICDAKEIPYIDTYMDFNGERSALNLFPHHQQLARALYDLIRAYGWQQFTFLYETGDFLIIFDEIISLYGMNIPTITIRRYDIGLDHSYYNVLRGIKKSKDNSVLIVGSIETIEVLLKQAQEIGIITDEYDFIIGNLDLQTLDLRRYQYSECNMTSFRIVSPQNEKVIDLIETLGYSREIELRDISCPINTHMALLYDGIQIFANAVKHLEEASTKPMQYSAPQIDCSDDSQWEHGFSLMNQMAFLTSTKSLTGEINFYFGLRNQFNLDIIELTTSGLNQIGIWNSSVGIQINRPVITGDHADPEIESLNQTFIVLISLTRPYGMLKHSSEKLEGNERYEGFGIELIKQLAHKLGFNYTFKLQEDNNYGSFNATTKEATGMLREIIHKRAQLAITDLTITSERALGVDFTIPFMNLGISILYRKAQKEPPKLFSFMDPFSKEVWLYLGVGYVGVSLSFFILGRLSPTEWDNPYPCIENPTELENQFSLGNSLWFSIGALLQQGSEIAPKSPSTRTVASIWWFFTMIIVASYTANLAAFLTIESSSTPINDIHDLEVNKAGVKYGAKQGGATLNFFKGSKKYKKIWEYMQSHPELNPSTNEEGVDMVATQNYAFLMESTTIEYNVERNCNLSQVGDLLDEKGYGIAMHKDFKFRDKINSALLELQEAGAIGKLKTKWWQEVTDGCSKKKKETEKAEALGMPNLGGVYFVLLVGSIMAAVFGVIKWLLITCKRAYSLKVPLKEELMEELKFVLDCSKNVKTVKSTESSYSRHSSLTMDSVKEANMDEESARLTH